MSGTSSNAYQARVDRTSKAKKARKDIEGEPTIDEQGIEKAFEKYLADTALLLCRAGANIQLGRVSNGSAYRLHVYDGGEVYDWYPADYATAEKAFDAINKAWG